MVTATGLAVVDERPAAAADDPTPVLTVSGQAACGPLDEAYTVITWTVSQDTFYGGEFTNVVVSPADGLYGWFTDIRGTAAVVVSQMLPWGHGATSASLNVTVRFNLPNGPQVVSAGTTVALPSCPKRVPPGVTFTKQCDGSVAVRLGYPAAAQLATTITVTGSVPDWTSDVSLSPGDVKTVTVPRAYTSHIRVDQDHSVLVAYTHEMGIPNACWVYTATPYPSFTLGTPVLPPPHPGGAAGGAAGDGGGGMGGPGGGITADASATATTDQVATSRGTVLTAPGDVRGSGAATAAAHPAGPSTMGTVAAYGATIGIGGVAGVAAVLFLMLARRRRTQAIAATSTDADDKSTTGP